MSLSRPKMPETGQHAFGVSERLPSGQTAELFEVLTDQVGDDAWLRFRFHAPSISREHGTVSSAEAEADFEHLCTNIALPYMAHHQLKTDVVSIALLDQPAPFGATDESVTQFVDAFRVSTGACVWEDPW